MKHCYYVEVLIHKRASMSEMISYQLCSPRHLRRFGLYATVTLTSGRSELLLKFCEGFRLGRLKSTDGLDRLMQISCRYK